MTETPQPQPSPETGADATCPAPAPARERAQQTPAGGVGAGSSEIPLGICGCGCGGQVLIPRFIRGHRVASQLSFWQRVDRRGPDECWPWTGPVMKGYGRAQWRGRTTGTHRIAYILASGSDPGELHVDHLCHNRDTECAGGKTCLHRRCCNPAHLEAVTHVVNALRGKGLCAANAAKEKCIRGHEFDEANTLIRKSGRRTCRKCEAARSAARTAARTAARRTRAAEGKLAA